MQPAAAASKLRMRMCGQMQNPRNLTTRVHKDLILLQAHLQVVGGARQRASLAGVWLSLVWFVKARLNGVY